MGNDIREQINYSNNKQEGMTWKTRRLKIKRRKVHFRFC